MAALIEIDPATAQPVRDVLKACARLHDILSDRYLAAAPLARIKGSRTVLGLLAAREAEMSLRLQEFAAETHPWLDIWLAYGVHQVAHILPVPDLTLGPAELVLDASRVDDQLWSAYQGLSGRSGDPRLHDFTDALTGLFMTRRRALASLLVELDLP